MRAWFSRARTADASPSEDQAQGSAAAPASPYSAQYETIVSQGHDRPPPAFGAPTLVWHVAIWPRKLVAGKSNDPHDTAGEEHTQAKTLFEKRREDWVGQFELLLRRIQERGVSPGSLRGPAKAPRLVAPHDLSWDVAWGDDFARPVHILEQETIPFTVWWADRSEPSEQQATANAIRVSVHAEVNADYIAITFYMDIGQRWNEPHDGSAQTAKGSRRARLLRAVDDIRLICEAQLEPKPPGGAAAVDLPPLPEALASPDGRNPQQLHDALKAARNLLYVDIWELFARETGCSLEDIAGPRGEVFANFRGLVMSTQGVDGSQSSSYRPAGAATGHVGTVPFANFSRRERFNADGAEPNAVAKAFWPFLRRVTPRADYRDFVACGVLNWRAIYITALGSHSQYVKDQERQTSAMEEGEASIRVPPHLLGPGEQSQAAASEEGHFDALVHKRKGTRGGNNHPVRYLLLTKFEPHPRQVGRIAERINTMGTVRLYALRDWAAVRNADPFIRILGQELDQITENWGRDRQLINKLKTLEHIQDAKEQIELMRRGKPYAGWDKDQLERLEELLPRYVPVSPVSWAYRAYLWFIFHLRGRRRDYKQFLAQLREDLVADVRHSALYHISSEVETQLIDISAELDRLGTQTIGGLHFRLNRSAYYVREFNTLLKTLQVSNIQTWTSYEQFVRRGLRPAFDYIAGVGQRLAAVRTRLLAVTEMIETSALVGQSAATRHNTAVLRQTTTLAIVILLAYLAYATLHQPGPSAVGSRIAGYLYGLLPKWLATRIDELMAMIQSLF